MYKFSLIYILTLIPILVYSQDQKVAVSKYPGVAVIELFTSQGDINSPPADHLLSEIIADAEKNNKPVYCLSMHVDFWNRYGWNDPFSSLKYTRRLTNYTSVLGQKETYTPLLLINGNNLLPVIDRKQAFSMIETALSVKATMIPEFTYEIFDDTLDLIYNVNTKYVIGKAGSNKYINVAIVEKGLITKVTKGDNAGKTLRNDNVTSLLFTADLKAPKGLIRVPLKSIKPGNSKSIFVFIQEKRTRKVIGASAAGFTP